MLAAFDIEIAKPVTTDDWKSERPLGISCAAVATQDGACHMFHGIPQMTVNQCQQLVRFLQWLTRENYTLVTWNGMSFDFDILSEESQMHQECVDLALAQLDLMFIVVSAKGHYLGLQKACQGMGVNEKKKVVTLNDGSTIDDMSGSKAPELWAAGEYRVVKEYLTTDVEVTLELAQAVKKEQSICWMSNAGNPQMLKLNFLPNVMQCLNTPPKIAPLVDRARLVEWATV